MTTGETNLEILTASMSPKLNEGAYVFCSLKEMPDNLAELICFFKEEEKCYTCVCSVEVAEKNKWQFDSVFSWITLTVHSSLNAVGLTAAFSKTLAESNISCNVVAGFYHDHIFVPIKDTERALVVLRDLAGS